MPWQAENKWMNRSKPNDVDVNVNVDGVALEDNNKEAKTTNKKPFEFW